MRITDNRRAIILTGKDSPYFEQSIFVLKENVVLEEDKLLNEARSVAERYAKKCEKSRSLIKNNRSNRIKCALSAVSGGVFGAIFVLAIIFA